MKTLSVHLFPPGDIYELLNLAKEVLQLETDVKHIEMVNKVLVTNLALTFVQVSKMISEFLMSWYILRSPGKHSHQVTAL